MQCWHMHACASYIPQTIVIILFVSPIVARMGKMVMTPAGCRVGPSDQNDSIKCRNCWNAHHLRSFCSGLLFFYGIARALRHTIIQIRSPTHIQPSPITLILISDLKVFHNIPIQSKKNKLKWNRKINTNAEKPKIATGTIRFGYKIYAMNIKSFFFSLILFFKIRNIQT